jgi:diacylglycerol kinase family enzyme
VGAVPVSAEKEDIDIQVGREIYICAWYEHHLGSGRYHGGGMLVAPDAVTDDGLFHVTVIGAMSLPLVFWHLPKLYTGKIKVISQVSMQTGKRVTAGSEQRVLLDIDGEQPGTLPADLEIVPSALKMIMSNGKK